MEIEHRTKGQNRRETILAYILEYQHQNGFSPSVGEISEEIGSVRSNIHHHLRVLSVEGRLTSKPKAARSWVVRQ
jgi:SOS-response transcriptional repressor LexA